MAKRHKGTVPEFGIRRTRAGFLPAEWDKDAEVELWQVWLRSSEHDQGKRATFDDLEAAGFKPRRKVWG